MKTAWQVAEKSVWTVYVHYDEQIKQYEAFPQFGERKDDSKKDQIREEWIQKRSIAYLEMG